MIQFKWQLLLLNRNSVISISLIVTSIYGLLLYLFRGVDGLDTLLVSLVLNDPSVIGYFFLALSIYNEMKHQILPAIFTTPLNIHTFILSKSIAISIVGIICSLGLAISVKGFGFDLFSFTIGAMGVCLLSTLLGLYMLTFADEFLKFVMVSIIPFLIFVNIPLLQYLGVIDMGYIRYLFPIQGSLDLIDRAIRGTVIDPLVAYSSMVVMIPLLYWLAFKRFSKKIVAQ